MSHDHNPDVEEMVREQLQRPDPPKTRNLYARAIQIDPTVREISKRQFHAKYPLQVKRQMSQQEKEDGATATATAQNDGEGKKEEPREPGEIIEERERFYIYVGEDGEKRYACKLCDYDTDNSRGIGGHMNSHLDRGEADQENGKAVKTAAEEADVRGAGETSGSATSPESDVEAKKPPAPNREEIRGLFLGFAQELEEKKDEGTPGFLKLAESLDDYTAMTLDLFGYDPNGEEMP